MNPRKRLFGSNTKDDGPAPAAASTPAPVRVLFVDDERLVLEGLRDGLRKFRFHVESAESAERGLEILANTEIDVVISDERMPQMSGSEFLALVCERYPETLRIMLSGERGPAAGTRALYEAEVFRFVHKPCSPAELVLIIMEGLAARPSG
jgi:two-component system probable response regulator PhcQ